MRSRKPMPPLKPHAARPVRRRALPRATYGDEAHRRALRAVEASLVRGSLAARLREPSPVRMRLALAVGACSFGVLSLGGVEPWVALPVAAGVAGAALGAAARVAPRRVRRAPDGAVKVAAAFDRLHAASLDLPVEARDVLARMQHRLARILSAIEGELAGEDGFFVLEAVRRYLPDAIAAYRAIPAACRDAAAASLIAQLGAVLGPLARIDEELASRRRERLDAHRAFLEAKRAA